MPCLNCGFDNLNEGQNRCPICGAPINHEQLAAPNVGPFYFTCPAHRKRYEFSSPEPVNNWTCSCSKSNTFIPYVGTAYPMPETHEPDICLKDTIHDKIIVRFPHGNEEEKKVGRKDFVYMSAHMKYNTISEVLFELSRTENKGILLKVLTNHSTVLTNNVSAPANCIRELHPGDTVLINDMIFLTVTEAY